MPAERVTDAFRRRRGRPRKFAGPSRAVTVTLPEDVLSALATVHPDLAHAIVHVMRERPQPVEKRPAELLVFGKRAVITVAASETLEKRAGVQLVPLPDGRALISFEHPRSVAELELTLHDLAADSRVATPDRRVFAAIGALLKQARRARGVSLEPRNIVMLQYRSGARRKGAPS